MSPCVTVLGNAMNATGRLAEPLQTVVNPRDWQAAHRPKSPVWRLAGKQGVFTPEKSAETGLPPSLTLSTSAASQLPQGKQSPPLTLHHGQPSHDTRQTWQVTRALIYVHSVVGDGVGPGAGIAESPLFHICAPKPGEHLLERLRPDWPPGRPWQPVMLSARPAAPTTPAAIDTSAHFDFSACQCARS
jgi:hypothetical protein